MITKPQFKSQISRLGVLFMRETPNDMLREMYEIFKEKDFIIFEKAISEIIANEDRFPPPKTIQYYYEQMIPPKEAEEPLTRKDLEKAAKTSKHKHYLKLIFGLMDGEITIDHPEVQKCLDEQGPIRVFSHYDKEKRCFVKIGRETHPKEYWDELKEQLKKKTGIRGVYIAERRNYFAKLRKELGLND